MASVDENIQGLSHAILDEARGETEQVKAGAQAKADEIRKRAEVQAEAERKAILDQASREAERLRSQTLATAQLKARSSELAHREKLLDRAFKAVRQQVPDLQKRPDYEQIAAALIREGVEQLKTDKAEVRADEATGKVLTPKLLDELSKECHAQLSAGDPLEQGTGVVLSAEGGHLYFDNTFETRLSRLQNRLRPAAFQILMGESS
ncbi:MAG TPA: V-type ATP synthase subunit E family protein [Anaerolineales bacterium]